MARILYVPMPAWVHGLALSPSLILIDPSRRDDAVHLAHEREHCDQMRRVGTVRFWWRYLTDATFRQAAEVGAYRVSYAHAPERLASFATALSTRYRLRLSFDTAAQLIAAAPAELP